MFCVELFEAVADATTNVNQQNGVFSFLEALYQSFCHGVEIGIHPARASLSISGHVVPKRHRDGWTFDQPFKAPLFGLVTCLKWTISMISRVLVICFFEVSWKVQKRWTRAVETRTFSDEILGIGRALCLPKRYCITDSGLSHRPSHFIGFVGVGSDLCNHSHSGEVF